jgi:tRNA-2-methylthio-N6-dimethylallyladenosine synthase
MQDTAEKTGQPRRAEAGAPRKAFIRTYGCQMNVYDSQRLGDALERDGYVLSDKADEADLIVLNTCHIREKAAEKVYSELGRVRAIKQAREKRGARTMVAVAGCVAQAEGAEIVARAPIVDVVVGPQAYHRMGEYLARASASGPVVATDFELDAKFSQLPAPSPRQTRARGATAFVTIQEGCDKFCAFCVVPYTRGAELSRPASQILEEVSRLQDAGVREVTLLGQNVNAWHGAGTSGGSWRLGDLLEALSRLDGIARLRYTTSHPIDMDDSLIAAHRDLPKLMPYLHLPVQAGSDRVLKAMNRHHSRQYYLDLIGRIRAACPQIALSGDFIVGFPGETESDFGETLDLIEKVRYAQAFSFKYSARPGTPGAEMVNQVPDNGKRERLARLQAVINAQQAEFNRACIGKRTEILLEKTGRDPGQLIGRSPWLQSVVVDDSAGGIGNIVAVRIVAAGPNSLSAVPQ